MYIEIALGSATHQGKIIKTSELVQYMKLAVENKQELYRSTFSFDNKIIEHMASGRKSASGFIGNCFLDHIILDVDKGYETDKNTLWRARMLIDKLLTDWKLTEDDLQYWHSGTGYHIVIPDIFGFVPSPTLPRIVKDTLDKYFPETDHKFYHTAGLIRVGYTINDKSQRYKTPMSYEEIKSLTLEEIYNLSKEPRLGFKYEKVDYKPVFQELIVTSNIDKVNKSIISVPNKIVSCVQHMWDRGEEVGTRHERIMRMTSAWRRAGLPLDAIIALMKQYSPNMDAYEVEKHVKDVFSAGYSYGCEDNIMKQFCDPQCIHYKHKDYAPHIMSSSIVEETYAKFMQTDFTGRAFDLSEIITLPMPFMIYPGYFVTLIGDTGLNKTAFFQNLAVSLPNYPILYISTEFSNMLLFRRFIQIAHKLKKEQVEEHYSKHSNDLSKKIKHIHFLKSTPNIQELDQLIAKTQPKIVMIDTIDDILVPGEKQGVGKDELLAMDIKQMAEKYEVIIMAIHHLRKADTVNDEGQQKPLTVHSGKGSGSFSQKPDVVLGLEGHRDKSLRTLRVLKARDARPFTTAFDVDMNTFIFNQLIKR